MDGGMGQRREGPRGLVDCALYRPFDVVAESRLWQGQARWHKSLCIRHLV